MQLPINPEQVKGFLAEEEGRALFDCAMQTAALGPGLEVGSYCGKSTVYLGAAYQQQGSQLFAVDHHRGSEEHQPGEEYHDPALYDGDIEQMDSFRVFRQTLELAGLEDTVIPVVARSALLAKFWSMPLGLVFIDGGHSLASARSDYQSWAGHVAPGGILAIHDIFRDPSAGGQAPFTILRWALDSELFDELPQVNTLGLLRRRG